MPRRKNSRHYVVDQLQEEDPESYFKYVSKTPHGVADDQSEFLKAIRNLSVQKVRGFLNKGLDPNFYNNYSCGMEDRVINVEPDLIPLHLAVSGRRTDTTGSACEKIVGVLLFFGADPNCKDRYGDSALHVACVSGNLATVRLLLDAGADVASVNNKQAQSDILSMSDTLQMSGKKSKGDARRILIL
ncbi:ankyrin repeat domain-containing protein 54-like [Plakobranchus ocellatus]|uniref:Ankyrin repeat domain-containing protein 54-like n=1 Tax=Plakobranchus ocellatus TaxID=259542 RepID=A0AAV4BPS6_9GAST|nr:ankyrin repeat domain-containing protein 54-like [Plakobranchus ocellatus]